jgi:hypothetical protein
VRYNPILAGLAQPVATWIDIFRVSRVGLGEILAPVRVLVMTQIWIALCVYVLLAFIKLDTSKNLAVLGGM